MNLLTYEEAKKDQGASLPGALLVAGNLFFTLNAPRAQHQARFDLRRASVGRTPLHLAAFQDSGVPVNFTERIIERIRSVSQDPELRDDGEQPPTDAVLASCIRLLSETARVMRHPMPYAQVSTFFGELNLTWKSEDAIVRLAVFADGRMLVQTGSVLLPVGSHRSVPNPTPRTLAERLEALAQDNDPEGPTFLG
jgi:hypothetical protein